MIQLTVFHNDEPIKTYEINKTIINIGRLPENDIPIASISISRRHVRIEQDTTGSYIISDLNSLNGTFVNNKKIKKLKLSSGDKITMGKYSMLFEISTQSADTAEIVPAEAEELTVPVDNPPANIITEDDSEKPEQQVEGEDSSNPGILIETNKHVVYKLDKPAMSIGSSEGDDIFVDGFLITDGHVLIEKRDDGIWIHANKLMGRFKINGKKLGKHKLLHKDRIELGSSTFRYMESGQK